MEPIGTLYPISPYNFQLTLDVLSRYTHPFTDVHHNGAYWRVLPQGDSLALVRVTAGGTPDHAALDVNLMKASGRVNPAALLDTLAHILSVNIDPTPFYDFARQDGVLWQVVQPLVGLRWLRTDSVFEALMITTIEQQIAWTAAQKAQRWLVEWAGRGILHDGMTFYAFPSPEQIASASVEDLTPLKITFKRMRVMIDIAQQVVSGVLDLESLRHLPPEAMYKALVSIKGIGHWTASWTLQRTLGPHNYVGHNDVALQAAVNHYFYGGKGKIPEAQVVATFARFGDYAGAAANYTIMRWVLDRYPG